MTDPVPSALPDSGASVHCTDELLTGESALPTSAKVRKQSAGPAATVRHGSASVPIYRIISGTRTRFAISWYRDGKRMRQVFRTIEAAKKEAMVVARQIQAGMQYLTDLKPHERDAFIAARDLADKAGLPLVPAMEDYLRARELAGTESLAAMATQYAKHFGSVVRRATVPEVVKQLVASREQDGSGRRHLVQLGSVLRRFAAACPGPILDVTSAEIDAWLRSLKVSPMSRNSMLVTVNILFSFALEQNYLPAGQPTAASQLRKVKVPDSDIGIFTPHEFSQIIHAAPEHLIPLLAISAFAGIRSAEIARLDWSAVDLDRRIIEVRAGQAKTASRRVIPISDNLAAWLAPLRRRGRVVPSCRQHREITALAKSLGIPWPRNVLRHSFISYRIAIVKSADQVALEAGNSPAIIFRHYRELTTEETAKEWFGIGPRLAATIIHHPHHSGM
jgi:integrase